MLKTKNILVENIEENGTLAFAIIFRLKRKSAIHERTN